MSVSSWFIFCLKYHPVQSELVNIQPFSKFFNLAISTLGKRSSTLNKEVTAKLWVYILKIYLNSWRHILPKIFQPIYFINLLFGPDATFNFGDWYVFKSIHLRLCNVIFNQGWYYLCNTKQELEISSIRKSFESYNYYITLTVIQERKSNLLPDSTPGLCCLRISTNNHLQL